MLPITFFYRIYPLVAVNVLSSGFSAAWVSIKGSHLHITPNSIHTNQKPNSDVKQTFVWNCPAQKHEAKRQLNQTTAEFNCSALIAAGLGL